VSGYVERDVIMLIGAIRKREELDRVGPAWRELYAADPEGQIFLSHEWLCAWRDCAGPRLVVLTARESPDSDTLLGVLPLRMHVPRQVGETPRLLAAGSRLADFSGFLARPEVELAVARAFGRAILRIGPSSVELDYLLASDRRLAAFWSGIALAEGRMFERPSLDNGDGVDLLVSPYAPLPADWEQYLAGLSANSRQKARRFLRRLDEGDELAVTCATAETLDRDAEILRRMWCANWSERKGDLVSRQSRLIAKSTRAFHRAGILELYLLWRGEAPIAAHAVYVDRVKRRLHFCTGVCDKRVQSPPPSFLLHCHTLRQGIADGFVMYDFMRGNEPYKYSFASMERRLRNVTVKSTAPGSADDARLPVGAEV
jgi:CelD/BcsL family acetyltransferase involved in cellulose biosynthesis